MRDELIERILQEHASAWERLARGHNADAPEIKAMEPKSGEQYMSSTYPGAVFYTTTPPMSDTITNAPDESGTTPEQRIQQLEAGLRSLVGQVAELEHDIRMINSRLTRLEETGCRHRLAELEQQVKRGLADTGQRLGRLEYVVNELDDERSKADV